MQVEYSSEEDDYHFRARPRHRDHSRTSSESASPVRKAKRQSKQTRNIAYQPADDSKSFASGHKSQLVLAALFAGGAAAAAYVLKRRFGCTDSKQKDAEEDSDPQKAPRGARQAESKKLAMRRKRSEHIPDAGTTSSAPASPRHKQARHEEKAELAASAAKAPSRLTKGRGSKPAFPSRTRSRHAGSSAPSAKGADQSTVKGLPQLTRRPSTGTPAPTPNPIAPSDTNASSASDHATASDKPAASTHSRGTASADDNVEAANAEQAEPEAQTSGSKDTSSAEPAGKEAEHKQGDSFEPRGKDIKHSQESHAQAGSSSKEASADEVARQQPNHSQGSKEQGKEGTAELEGAAKGAGDDEGGPAKPATGQEEDEGPEALEAAEKAVKEAADAMNKQLPTGAQGGSLAPLTEEQEGSERQHKGKKDEQTLDTFNAEHETFDLSRRSSQTASEGEEGDSGSKAATKQKDKEGGKDKAESKDSNKAKPEEEAAQAKGVGNKSGKTEGSAKEEIEQQNDKAEAKKVDPEAGREPSDGNSASADQGNNQGTSEGGKECSVHSEQGDGDSASGQQGDSEGARDSSQGGKEGSVQPEQAVPVRLESEPLEQPGSPKGAAALEDQKPTAAAKERDEEAASPDADSAKQAEPQLKPQADDSGSEPERGAPPRAPSPPSSHVSVEEEEPSSAPQQGNAQVAASEASDGKAKDNGKLETAKSAFDERAQRAFSDKLSDVSSADINRKASASSGSYTGLNPTGTRSASRLFSGGMAPESAPKKEAPPMTKRDMVANSILQLQMDTELDTFTADIDCLYDSSDEEEERPAAKGKKEEAPKESKENKEQAKASGTAQPKPAPGKQKKKADGNAGSDSDEEDVDHANIEDLSSDDSHNKLERVENDEDAGEEDSTDAEEEEEEEEQDDKAEPGADDHDKPDDGSGGGAAASGSGSGAGQNATAQSGSSGGRQSSGGGGGASSSGSGGNATEAAEPIVDPDLAGLSRNVASEQQQPDSDPDLSTQSALTQDESSGLVAAAVEPAQQRDATHTSRSAQPPESAQPSHSSTDRRSAQQHPSSTQPNLSARGSEASPTGPQSAVFDPSARGAAAPPTGPQNSVSDDPSASGSSTLGKKRLTHTLEDGAAAIPAVRTLALASVEGPAPGTPDNAHPNPSNTSLDQACSLSDSEPDAISDANSAAAAGIGLANASTEDGAGTAGTIVVDVEYVRQHAGLLQRSPLIGNHEELRRREEVLPKSKAEKNAAKLQMEASRLFQQPESKERGEKLQRQVLQFLCKDLAQPGFISGVASHLADMLYEQDKFEDAEEVLAVACSAAKEAGQALAMMKLCNNLGAVQRKKLGKTAASYAVYQDALSEAVQAFGRASSYTLIARSNVVEVLSDLGQHATAEILLQDAAQDLITATQELQDEYLAIQSPTEKDQVKIARLKEEANQAALMASRCFAELGKQQSTQGKDEDAEECFCQALELVRAIKPRGHPEGAFTLGAFASFCKNKQGAKYQHRAIEFYAELQHIMEGLHGFDNEQNAIILQMMGNCYKHLEQYGEAAECAKKAVQALGGVMGHTHPALEPWWQTVAEMSNLAGDKPGSKAAQKKVEKLHKAYRQAQIASGGKRQAKARGRKAFSS